MNAPTPVQFETMELLRFSTAGSVDDGKSTLIGRLLYDSKSIFEDTLEAIGRTTQKRGGEGFDLALLTDGLQAEREQGITIDVAYRYFATPRRKFIIADTPGHAQYTRNMVTGASTADVAVILVDARKGAQEQSRRHALISSMLGIRHLVIAINKMDLVDWSQAAFEAIRADFEPFLRRVHHGDITFLPMSALLGDMVVARGDNLGWHTGPTLLELLETTPAARDAETLPFRFPVQLVSRPQTPDLHDFRGYMGRVESGSVRVGDEVVVLPSGLKSRVKEILLLDQALESAGAPQSVTLTLTDELDISRGNTLVRAADPMPATGRDFDAMLCWMDEENAVPGKRYLLKQGATVARVVLASIAHELDVNSLAERPATSLTKNAIARVRLRAQQPLLLDAYAANRATGAFILIDEFSNQTTAGGMIHCPTVS